MQFSIAQKVCYSGKRKTFFTLRKKMVILRVPSFLRVQSITGNGELWDVECPLSALVHAPCLNSQSSCCWHLCHLCRPPYPDLLSAPTPSSWVPARPPFSLSLWARLPPRQSAGALDAASSLLELVPMEAGPERHSWKFYKRSGRKAGRQTERFVRAASLSLFTCALVLYLYPCPSLSQSRASRTGSFFPPESLQSKSERKCDMRTVLWEINGQITKGRKGGADVTHCAAHDNAWKERKTGRLQLFLSLSVTISAPSGKGRHTFWQGDAGLLHWSGCVALSPQLRYRI